MNQDASANRSAVIRDALGVGIASGAYALSFGALSTAAGLDVLQTCALSLFVFTGASQFALIGVIAGGGSPLAGASTAILLGTRNAFYGLRLTTLLKVKGGKRLVAAHFVLDESTAMAVGRESEADGKLGFWSTGLSVFVLWNLGTLLGALGAEALSDPEVLGLDAAVPAAFLALVAPRLRSRETWMFGCIAAAVAIISVPLVPAGSPVLLAAAVATVMGIRSKEPLEDETP